MKIIKNNYKPPKTIMSTTKVKCCVCDSILEVSPEDLIKHRAIFINEVGQPEVDFNSWYYTINCPCCGEDARFEGSVPIDDFVNGKLYNEDYIDENN